jgi:hypothetical protein
VSPSAGRAIALAVFIVTGTLVPGCNDDPPAELVTPPTDRATTEPPLVSSTLSSSTHDHFPNTPFTGVEPAGRTDDGRYLTLINTGMYLVTDDPYGTEPTAEQRDAAFDFGAEVIDTIRERYRAVADAERAGYLHLAGDPMHYVSPDRLTDDHHADPAEPESLMYHPGPDGELVLLGAMFLEPEPGGGTEIGGPATAWHYHVYEPDPYCVVASGFPVGEPDELGHCVEGEIADRSPEMLHVWIWNPIDTFDGEVFTPTSRQLAEHFR